MGEYRAFRATYVIDNKAMPNRVCIKMCENRHVTTSLELKKIIQSFATARCYLKKILNNRCAFYILKCFPIHNGFYRLMSYQTKRSFISVKIKIDLKVIATEDIFHLMPTIRIFFVDHRTWKNISGNVRTFPRSRFSISCIFV